MHGSRYANVVATLALIVALGGTAYAAVRVTGRQVADGSLTGADVKKRSVPLNRLKGALPAGATGAKGDTGAAGPKGDTGAAGAKGETGATGTPDSSQFFTRTESDARFLRPGETIVAMWPHNIQVFSGLTLSRFTESAQITASSTGSSGFLLYPDLPVEIAGRALKLVGIDACYDAASPGVTVTGVSLIVDRVPRTDTPLATDVVALQTFTPPADGVGCQRLDLAAPFTLTSNDVVRAAASLNFTQTGGSGILGLGRWAFVFTSA